MLKDYQIKVNPIDDCNGSRPIWSVMIPTYNCAQYLGETLRSVLIQDQGAAKMQIEVIDDHSTKDDPESVVIMEAGKRVTFFKQVTNKGHNGNFETCLNRSKGKYVHLLHGDDCVLPGFYEKVEQVFNENPAIGAVFTRHYHIDEYGNILLTSPIEQTNNGLLVDYLRKITKRQIIQTPSVVVKREVYESIGGFDKRLAWCEDWEMWARVAASYPIGYVTEPMAKYRIHTSSNSGRYIQTGQNLKDLKKGINIIADYANYMPRSKYLNAAYDNYANYGIETAKKLLTLRSGRKGAFNQWKVALTMVRSRSTLIKSLVILKQILLRS